MTDLRTPVLIVGAGLAGLTAATLLAWRGVPCLLVERRASTSRHPRARGVNLRTLELLRQVPGLEDDLRQAGRPGLDRFTMLIAESVTGRVIRSMVDPKTFDASLLSPAPLCTAGQDRIEPILLKHARALGADIRFNTEMAALAQDSGGVDVVLRDRESGLETRARANYVIAADGARSPTRERLRIPTSGRGTISHFVSIIFAADLGFLADRGFCLYYLQNKDFTGAFVVTDEVDRGQISIEYDPSRKTIADFTTERCVAMVRAALGLPDAAVDILDTMAWDMASRIAERMRDGRVVLAGDAAHTMRPTGGLGGETAMQDAADLAWKVPLVLRGEADPALLATYEAERLPVARMTVARQTEQYVERMRPDRTELASEGIEKDYLAVALGYRYRSPTIQDDSADAGTPAESPLRPSSKPGMRLAHVWLERDGTRLSSVDLVGDGFILIAGTRGLAWVAAAAVLSASGDPIAGCRLGGDLIDPDGAFARTARLEPHGAILVRPDGMIAWRFEGAHADPAGALRAALDRALCRVPQHRAKAA